MGVISSYYKNPEEDAHAFTEDGWFRTGDLARFDERGYLKIVGRKKEIIVTAGGKNVIPGIAEGHLRTSPLVSQAMLVGDEKPFISALVTLDPDTLPEQLEHLGLPRSLSIPEAAVHPAVRAAIQKLVDEANQLVSRAEGIREFRIMQEYAAEQSEKFAELREQAAERLHEYADHQAERLAELREQAAEKFEELREQTAEMMQKPHEDKAEDDAKKSEKAEKAEDSSAEAPVEKAEAKKAESDNA